MEPTIQGLGFRLYWDTQGLHICCRCWVKGLGLRFWVDASRKLKHLP